MKKNIGLSLVLLIVVGFFVGCASMPKETADSAPRDKQSDYHNSEGESSNEDGFGPPTGGTEGQLESASGLGNKIIKTGYMEIETLDFDNATTTIVRRLTQVNGFIESSNVDGVSRNRQNRGRKAWYKLRVPSNKLEQFMTDAGAIGNVIKNESAGEDISAKYFDTEARLRSLEVREQRLLAILQEATNLTDILELERELTGVRYEIENLTGTLIQWDNMVDYSTLEIQLIEVKEIVEEEEEPVTLWERISSNFTKSLKAVVRLLEHTLVILVTAFPFIVLFGVLAIAVLLILKLIKSKKE